jgi:hypothetical protein
MDADFERAESPPGELIEPAITAGQEQGGAQVPEAEGSDDEPLDPRVRELLSGTEMVEEEMSESERQEVLNRWLNSPRRGIESLDCQADTV